MIVTFLSQCLQVAHLGSTTDFSKCDQPHNSGRLGLLILNPVPDADPEGLCASDSDGVAEALVLAAAALVLAAATVFGTSRDTLT